MSKPVYHTARKEFPPAPLVCTYVPSGATDIYGDLRTYRARRYPSCCGKGSAHSRGLSVPYGAFPQCPFTCLLAEPSVRSANVSPPPPPCCPVGTMLRPLKRGRVRHWSNSHGMAKQEYASPPPCSARLVVPISSGVICAAVQAYGLLDPLPRHRPMATRAPPPPLASSGSKRGPIQRQTRGERADSRQQQQARATRDKVAACSLLLS